MLFLHNDPSYNKVQRLRHLRVRGHNNRMDCLIAMKKIPTMPCLLCRLDRVKSHYSAGSVHDQHRERCEGMITVGEGNYEVVGGEGYQYHGGGGF